MDKLFLFLSITIIVAVTAVFLGATESISEYSNCPSLNQIDFLPPIFVIKNNDSYLKVYFDLQNSTLIFNQNGILVEKAFFDNGTLNGIVLDRIECSVEGFNYTIVYGVIPPIQELRGLIVVTNIGRIELKIDSIIPILDRYMPLSQEIKSYGAYIEMSSETTTIPITTTTTELSVTEAAARNITSPPPSPETTVEYKQTYANFTYKDILPLIVGLIILFTSYILIRSR